MVTATIPLPSLTADKLRVLIAQRDALEAQIRILTDTAGECLNVPQGAQLQVQPGGTIAFVVVTDGESVAG